jgi:hypothetical protein
VILRQHCTQEWGAKRTAHILGELVASIACAQHVFRRARSPVFIQIV